MRRQDAIVWKADVERNIVSVSRGEENVMRAAIAGVVWTRSDSGRGRAEGIKKQRPNWDLLNKRKDIYRSVYLEVKK